MALAVQEQLVEPEHAAAEIAQALAVVVGGHSPLSAIR
jgi:hypothetical protein